MRTLPLFAILVTCGAVVLMFTLLTVHRRTPEELRANATAQRSHFAITHWIEHGYFASGGLTVRTSAKTPLYFHRSSTGGRFLTAFLSEKAYAAVTGHYSWRLLALHNQIISMLTAVLLGVLGFRLAARLGVRTAHALVLAICVQTVHFTFPDNLGLFWGSSGREWLLAFAFIFLLIEERSGDGRTRVHTVLQALAAFLLVYMEYLGGLAFLSAYAMATLMLEGNRPALKRLAITCALPILLALGLIGAQLTYVKVKHANVPKEGSGFLFRTGLDGSSTYYGDHLDIANRRDIARGNFPHNRPYLFRWPWLFFGGAVALLTVLLMAMRGRVPRVGVVSVVSLLGAYLLYAALFSQAVVIHPYLYDVLLFTPLVLSLLVIAPALLESTTRQSGIIVIAVFFLAVWVSMVQLRRFALQYPPAAPTKTSALLPAPPLLRAS
jgi:hypothetical protein